MYMLNKKMFLMNLVKRLKKKTERKWHLFAEAVVRCKKPISLTVDGGCRTPTNGIHFPMGVVIVHHMKISMSTSVAMRKVTEKT